jgi:uncharacterized protein (TIGR03437 family)
MTKRSKIVHAKIAVILCAVPVLIWAFEYGPPELRTGAPGDTGTCADAGCHTGTAVATTTAIKFILPNGNSYTPGVKQHIQIQIIDSVQNKFGFELTARAANSPATVQAGDFTNTDVNSSNVSLTQVLCSNGAVKKNGTACPAQFPLQFIEHTLAGYNASTKGSYTYGFDWTPPATNVGNITLYVAANAANGDLTTSGDHIYTANLTLTPAASTPTPTINAGGIGPIYSTATSIQPGSWISIYGSNLVSSLGVWDGISQIPTTLGGASVTINGKQAYLWVAVPKAFGNTDQINAQAPDDTATGTVAVSVTNATNGTATSTVTLAPVGPSFNVLGDAANHAAAVILTPDGSGRQGGGTYDIDGPAGTSLGYPTRPAKAGEFVILFGVGFGPTNPPVPAGKAYSGPAGGAPLTSNYQLTIGGVPIPAANITLAAMTGAGLYQFNILLPSGLGTGDKALQAIVAGVSTPTGVVLALQ